MSDQQGLETRANRETVAAAAAAGALPAISAEIMIQALTAYKELQGKLDHAMPEQIMNLDGKPFRKKGYWRAVALAFNLTVEPVSEQRLVSGTFKDGRENFGWIATYRASHPTSGRSQTGDGACFAVEKARRFKCPHPESEGSRRTKHFPHNTCPDFDPDFSWRNQPAEATEHNVRSHAHTRAYNRAVSNLVGFGEVSAEEVEHGAEDAGTGEPRSAGRGSTTQAAAASGQAHQPTTAAAAGTTYVKQDGIKEKKGKAGNKPWTRRSVTFEDGREAVTFSDSLTAELEAAMRDRTPVNPEIVKGEKGNDLKGLLPIVKPEPPQEPDEPVNGPEQVLTVRKVTTDKGDRWVIQTAKRQLITDQEAHANEAVRARNEKLGVVPSFDVVDVGGGKHANKLKGITVEAPEPGSEG